MVFLMDMKGSKAGHLFQSSISSVRKLLKLVQDGCPFKIREIHILNTVPFLDLILSIIKHIFQNLLILIKKIL